MTDMHIPPSSSGSALLDQIRAGNPARRQALWRITKPLALAPIATRTWTMSVAHDDIGGGSALDPRLTFLEFISGACNELAFVEAQRCAIATRPIYNPLYLCGSPGLGKTHLLQAIAHRAGRRRVMYLTAERILYGFLRAADREKDFRTALQDIDILAIDDFQFLYGAALSTFVSVFMETGRQLVIAAGRPPVDLARVDEWTRSRLSGGLCIEIGVPDHAMRIKILEARIAHAKQDHPAFVVSDEVVEYVAGVIQSNGRDLCAAVNRLLAHFLLHPAPCSMMSAEVIIRDLAHGLPLKKVRIEDVQKLVSKHFDVTVADLLSVRRTLSVVRPRQIAMYLSKILTLRSLADIARRFADRDHTTVLHAVRVIEKRLLTDPALAEEIKTLREMLERP